MERLPPYSSTLGKRVGAAGGTGGGGSGGGGGDGGPTRLPVSPTPARFSSPVRGFRGEKDSRYPTAATATTSVRLSVSGARLSRGAGGGVLGALGRHRGLAAALGVCLLLTLMVTLILNRAGPEELSPEEQIQGRPTRAFCNRHRPPLVCAHGGDTRRYPPNTQQAFQAAIDMAVDCVEVDAALTADGVLVVLHVRELQQLMDSRYKNGMQVGDLRWPELQSLLWPGGERVMLVKDAVRLTSPYVDCVTLDVKTYQDRSGHPKDESQLVNALTHLIHETGCHNCLIWAKSDKIVAAVNDLSPGQRTGYILMNQTREAREQGMGEPLRMEAPEVVGAYYGMVDGVLVEHLHEHGKQAYVWTVNEVGVMRAMLDAGVDALVTNFPMLVQQGIEWRMARCGDGGLS